MKTTLNAIAAALALLLLAATSPVQAAILDGQTVTTSYANPFPHGIPGPYGSYDSVVGSGTELTNIGNPYFPFDIDFSDTNILITSAPPPGAGCCGFYYFLDFFDTFDTIPSFTGVTINPATNFTGFDSSRLSFSENWIGLTLSQISAPQGQVISLDLTATVPEPATVGLLLVGICFHFTTRNCNRRPLLAGGVR